MPGFSHDLEDTLHRALALANERRHELVTLEHLLLSLTEDGDATAVLNACGVDIRRLHGRLVAYLDEEFKNLVGESGTDAKPTAGFHRVVQRDIPARNCGRARTAIRL